MSNLQKYPPPSNLQSKINYLTKENTDDKYNKFHQHTSKKRKKRKKMHKNVSLPRERERERLLIPRINPSSIRLEGKKKSKRRERKDHSDLTCYSHATLRIDYPPTNYHRCSIPVYTRGSFEDVAETGSRRTRGI